MAASFCPLDAQMDSHALRPGLRARRATGRAPRSSRAPLSGRSRRPAGASPASRRIAGPITAGQVVLAAGAWTPFLGAQLGLDIPIHPMRLQIVQTEPMPPRLDVLLYGPAAVKQYSIFQELPSFRPETFATELEDRLGLALLESACQTADGSYLLGCAMDYPGFDWQPDLAGVSLVADGLLTADPGASRGAFRSCLGRHSCRSPPTTCRSSAVRRRSTT